MTSHCEQVAERVALGEPLGDARRAPRGLRRLPAARRAAATARRARQAVDPGLGFAARMTAGAQHRIVVRRRRRVAAGLAATVAAGVLGVFFVTREPDPPRPAVALPAPKQEDAPPVAVGDSDLKALVNLADTRRSLRLSADWKRIQRPVAAYRKLVREVAFKGEAP